MYVIRYTTKEGGSGMTNAATNTEAMEKLINLFNKKQTARVEKAGIKIGEVYKSNGKWNWYIDTEA